MRNRWFESTSLHQRVRCEPDFSLSICRESVGFRPAMSPRYRDTPRMDHVSLYSRRRKPARQPEAVAAGFEGKRNPGDRAAENTGNARLGNKADAADLIRRRRFIDRLSCAEGLRY